MNTTFEKNFSEFEISIELELIELIRSNNTKVEETKIYEIIEEIVESLEYEDILEEYIEFDDVRTSEKFIELIRLKCKMFEFQEKFMK